MPWKEFIAEHNGSMANLLNRIGQDATRGDFTRLKTFLGYYKDEVNRQDIDRKWRDKANSKRVGQTISGKHEWIPTNMMPYMLSMAAGWEDVRWLIGTEILRTPCIWLIYRGRIRKTVKINQIDGKAIYANAPKLQAGKTVSQIADLQAHVGALYCYDSNKNKMTARQGGMPTWHSHLREIIRRHLNTDTNDLQGFWLELGRFIGMSIWDGSLEQLGNFADEKTGWLRAHASSIACDYSSARNKKDWNNCKTLADMSAQQAFGFQQFNAILCNQFQALLMSPGPKPSFSKDVLVILEDDTLPSDEDYQEDCEK